jgi:tellurite resistance protein
MSGFLENLTSYYQERLARLRNRPFLKATMAASALVAVADGSVSFSQRMRMDQIMETLTALKVFDPHEGVDLFNDYVREIVDSPKGGRDAALKAITAGARDDETKRLMIRVCLAISEASGDIGLVEQIEIVSLCSLLEVDPGACGLYTDVSPRNIETPHAPG